MKKLKIRMMLQSIILLFIFGISSIETNGQIKLIGSSTETDELSKKVTAMFKENKHQLAINELRPYWPLPAAEIDAFAEKTVKQLSGIEERFGKAEGILKVSEETIKDIAIRETYLVMYQFTALRLKFTYYKNGRGWIINSFKWDDSFTEEFK